MSFSAEGMPLPRDAIFIETRHLKKYFVKTKEISEDHLKYTTLKYAPVLKFGIPHFTLTYANTDKNGDTPTIYLNIRSENNDFFEAEDEFIKYVGKHLMVQEAYEDSPYKFLSLEDLEKYGVKPSVIGGGRRRPTRRQRKNRRKSRRHRRSHK